MRHDNSITSLDQVMSDQSILVINSGSSSIKFAVIRLNSHETIVSGIAERLGSDDARIVIDPPKKGTDKPEKVIVHAPGCSYEQAMDKVLAELSIMDLHPKRLLGIGHRVVHGGESFRSSVIIDDLVEDKIEACAKLAPLHNPANLQGIRFMRKLYPHLQQVAVFDTAFHQTLPPKAFLYAIPYSLYQEQAIRRYGFHGTSHRFVAEQAAKLLNKPLEECFLISAHLGNGCSATAIAQGQSVDTTMGLTPLEGLVMGTRSGDVDPGLLIHLATSCGYTIDELNRLLNKESGLQGLSGLSNDMRALQEAAASGHELAQLAIEIFCYRLAKAIGGLAVALPRIDALIFTGGIGENSALVRTKVLDQLKILGFTLNETANGENGRNTEGRISGESGPTALVVPTNEELMIALDTANLILKERDIERG